ncbi:MULTISPECIES: symmetrical bis(5'-nucleosyl)-tetraphosphatase [Halopseudomonas]|uniref:bis(5'-nucleosyl)-tetraphosphatase (symmetrical) n=1 Tax=Halopseudomonas bauzanensis TaxID=653930 RepID=A0A4U0YM33_9GAMM|nr:MULTISPECIES: symmetrical bis(5'-nucleosyl)-tetraphosphatase [Halopseudomonas]TKA93270.1 symmetrical bis(5'-nucleosyl)-tetraphosphatase [Halopseudomonas bauzanensis]WGK61267.1 symmetrical bis(5'-nucleosyl)-tetraphosphatase [Halopseudomonas sp. SMJS2]
MTVYAVGDIQGCLKPLQCLLQEVDFTPSRDTLWCVGDLVNRGPASLDTLRYLDSLGNACISVLGNHDLHLLAAAYDAKRLRKSDTLLPILQAPDREKLLDNLRQRPLAHMDTQRGLIMTHAGIPPIWSPQETLVLAAEVEAVLRCDQQLPWFLDQMYGNEPACWSPELDGVKRLRAITNYLTRMRFCRADGTLDFKSKDTPDQPPKGYAPWFTLPRRDPTIGIIFGHWAALEGKVTVPGIHALDTGCVWGNSLTLMNVDTGEKRQCDCDH